MIHDILMATAALFSGVTTVVVVMLAFKWGRWTGVVDTRLGHIEGALHLKQGGATNVRTQV